MPENCETSRHLFQIMVDDRDGLMTYLNDNDIFPGVHYVDNTQYRMYEYAHGTCPNTAYATDHILSLPLHLRLNKQDVDYIILKIVEFISR